jgi:hypothetical protein
MLTELLNNFCYPKKEKERHLVSIVVVLLPLFMESYHRFCINYILPKEERFQGVLFGVGFNNCDSVIASKSPVDIRLDVLLR